MSLVSGRLHDKRERRQRMKPILVTGLHRSGTTWLGRTLAYAPNTAYIHEPFNITMPAPYVHKPFDRWFQYVDARNEAKYRPILDPVFRHAYPTLSNLARARRLGHIFLTLERHVETLFSRLSDPRLVIKDPIAFFSTEWLRKTYHLHIVSTIRHPAAFCASLKVKNWRFDFKNFAEQPALMERYLEPFADEIRDHVGRETSIIDQGILLWQCFFHTLKILERDTPGFILVRHEEVSRNPLQEFERLYAHLDLKFTSSVRSRIEATTGSQNPVEPSVRNEFKRDSLRNISQWKVRLTNSEIKTVQRATGELAQAYYPPSDW